MDNQHRKISGYRELSEEEIALMNRIKEKGAELLQLHRELQETIGRTRYQLEHMVRTCPTADSVEALEAFKAAEPERWANIGRTDIQTGVMALVRSVARPQDGA